MRYDGSVVGCLQDAEKSGQHCGLINTVCRIHPLGRYIEMCIDKPHPDGFSPYQDENGKGNVYQHGHVEYAVVTVIILSSEFNGKKALGGY